MPTTPIAPQNPTESTAESYEVGYGHPPKHSQFKPGRSGNPSGRPKRRRSFATDFFAAMDALVPGAADKTKQQAVTEYLADGAALSHDAVALRIVVALATSLEEDTSENRLTAEQAQLIDDFNRRQAAAESMMTSQSNVGGDHED